MSDDTVTITVDGRTLPAKKGQMLIEVTDAAGINVPRFCYHKKLSVAANCRMCLVEVEKAPKPLPACATPIMPDMVVHTQSQLAREAQQGTMEFLLINHPLDCPICDQGGICELQDVAMGYGQSASQYTEGKRVVFDKYIGPLIATEMTRCIHCTRCVRFGEEIAGIRELGATGRGENVRIGTYIEKSVVSEVSGNVIDICPVGALTARPSRYSARAWELRQQPSIAPHDSVGSNISVFVDGTTVNQVVPRDNESVNEVWISDRDRFSYQGLAHAERLTAPLVRDGDTLVPTDWSSALARAAAVLKATPGNENQLATLVSPSSTLEELYLAQKLSRSLGSANVDHRLSQLDFSHADADPVMPWLGMQLADLETLNAALLIGSNLRKDQPIAAVRLRKSALAGAAISLINPMRAPLHFDAADEITVRHDQLVEQVYLVAKAAGADLAKLDNGPGAEPSEQHQRVAQSLKDGERAAVMLGNLAASHPARSTLMYLARQLARATNATLSVIPERGNTAGAWLAGAVPHRGPGGAAVDAVGVNARDSLAAGNASAIKRYLLVNVEVEHDAAEPASAVQALTEADGVVAMSSYLSPSLAASADVILPIAAFTETFGTWVNAAGQWQSSKGVVPPPGEARPGWKVMRVLAEALGQDGFGFDSPELIARELQQACANVELNNLTDVSERIAYAGSSDATLLRSGETPIYRTDPVVRRSQPLQKSTDGKQVQVSMNSATAQQLGVADGDAVTVEQGGGSAVLPARITDVIPNGCLWVPAGLAQTAGLGSVFGEVKARAGGSLTEEPPLTVVPTAAKEAV